jgi:CHAT domain-containing protein
VRGSKAQSGNEGAQAVIARRDVVDGEVSVAVRSRIKVLIDVDLGGAQWDVELETGRPVQLTDHRASPVYKIDARAEPLYRQALEVRKQALGDKHPVTVQSLNNLAFLYQMMGKSARAESMGREALDTCEQHLSDYMRVQSERQQLALARLMRSNFDVYLTIFERYFSHVKVRVLSGENATEAMFRREAPNYNWLHLATHGFFAPPELAPVLAASFDDNEHGSSVFSRLGIWVAQPGLMSGIALSGSNTRAKADEDDGILTAVEVAGLDLGRAQLVVLSACETGLGAVAGGEGVLGLQRAFQLAGANTCVTSLWKVDEPATQVLMTEFYKNLWEKRLGRLDSLRAAQLAMLRQYNPKEQKLRGLDLAEDNTMRPKRGSPHYWSAFVLSGDWR